MRCVDSDSSDLDDLWACMTTSDPVKEKNAKGKLILYVDKHLYVHIETPQQQKKYVKARKFVSRLRVVQEDWTFAKVMLDST